MFEKSSHTEWLSLLEVSGPFLAEPVLGAHFPQGLSGLDSSKKRRLRQAYEEWREAQDNGDSDFRAFHQAWINLVLKEGLELDEDDDEDVLKPAKGIKELFLEVPEYSITIKPDYIVVTDSDQPPSLLIQSLPAGVDLESANKADGYAASATERMVQLCRAAGVRLGLLTNGERWMLIDAPEGGVTSYASWYARLWSQEPVTLQAFVNLLGIRRFFLDPSQQLPALLDESVKHQDEVTDALGDQVSRAVEVLIQALDKADQDKGRNLLKGVDPSVLYEAGLTVMMRLVFLLSAEERGLLLMGDERYEAYYAVSSLRMQLREQAGRHSEEILSLRRDAWARLLAIFRAVYGGIGHESLRMPALGGSLFDPDQFPFLEGRAQGSNWRHDPAEPLPVDNRTVLLLLDAIQLYQGRTLSYRALDVEQIGYVYEGLLERTVIRASDTTLELSATKKSKKPWIMWGELENARLSGDRAVETLLEERSGSSKSRIANDLKKPVSESEKEKLLVVCQGDVSLRDRLVPFYHFLRIDPWQYPLLYLRGSFIVTTGSDRRETGTHYTPKSLTESIVKETLEPVVYIGPAEGAERKVWQLKSPAEILDLKVCDIAMGSGAFLVQVCRWLSERLLEAWTKSEARGRSVTNEGLVVEDTGDKQLIPADPEERLIIARRLISERCLYGVDVNPVAVELAKLSIWLVTMAKGRPFGFLDHNLRHGDSLLGITDLDQLHYLDLHVGTGSEKKLFAQKIDEAVEDANQLRRELRKRPILDIHDIEVMKNLDRKARLTLELPELVADSLIGETLGSTGKNPDFTSISIEAERAFNGSEDAIKALKSRALEGLSSDLLEGDELRKPFHWCLEFPEVFSVRGGGFDAIVGNPPFVGGQKITGALGTSYRNYLVKYVASGTKGSADLVAYFFLRAFLMLKESANLGLIAVNTISEGDTRQVGLERILKNNCKIINAYPNEPWPGSAAVFTSRIVMHKGSWQGVKYLANKKVDQISAFLTDRDEWSPLPLEENKGLSFIGSYILGLGFTLDEKKALSLISEDPKNSEVIFPYLNGRDLNTDPTQKPSRWVINFWDWPEEKAKEYAEPYRIIEGLVKPERQRRKENGEYKLRKPLPQRWWQYSEKRPALYHAIGRGEFFVNHPEGYDQFSGPNKKVLCITRVSKTVAFAFVPNDIILSEAVVVFPFESYAYFALLQSSIHRVFAWQHASKLKSDLRYSPSDVFETFAFPSYKYLDSDSHLFVLGKKYEEVRDQAMRDFGVGLTGIYTLFDDPHFDDSRIVDLRSIHESMDYAVASSYGWEDLDLEHGFHEVSYLPTSNNVIFSMSEKARAEVLHRLAMLNKERHEKEILESQDASDAYLVERNRGPLSSGVANVDTASKSQMDFFRQEHK